MVPYTQPLQGPRCLLASSSVNFALVEFLRYHNILIFPGCPVTICTWSYNDTGFNCVRYTVADLLLFTIVSLQLGEGVRSLARTNIVWLVVGWGPKQTPSSVLGSVEVVELCLWALESRLSMC